MSAPEIVPVQDNGREAALIDLFRLSAGGGRIGIDAFDESGHPFELKTTSKGGVSTARDVGPHTVGQWLSKYWIVAMGKNYRSGFSISNVFFLAPVHLKAFCDRIMSRFQADIELSERVKAILHERGFTADEVARVARLLHRGMLLNDPNIPKTYVLQNGIEITSDHPDTLRDLVAKFPLETHV